MISSLVLGHIFTKTATVHFKNVPEARPNPAPATRTGAAIPAVITVITPPAMVNVPARIPPPLPTTLNVSIFSYSCWKMFE